MDAIDLVTDQSKVVDEPDFLEKLDDGTFRKRPAYRPEEKLFAEHQVDVREWIPLMRIQDQSTQHWAAHLSYVVYRQLEDDLSRKTTNLSDQLVTH
jgi:hypothetical protein